MLAITAAGAEPDSREQECSRLHQQFRVEHGGDAKGLRDAWRGAGERCAGTGYYEYLLAADERRAGDVARAIAILEDMIHRKLPHHERGFVTLNSIRAEQAELGQPADRARIRALRRELIAFSDEHPELAYAHQQISKESIALEEFDVAATRARKALEIDASAAAARGYLVFALHELGRCTEAVPEIRKAIDGDRSLVADVNFMLAAIDCYAETGDVGTGEAALAGLLRNNPSVKNDARVRELQEYIPRRKAGPPPR